MSTVSLVSSMLKLSAFMLLELREDEFAFPLTFWMSWRVPHHAKQFMWNVELAVYQSSISTVSVRFKTALYKG